MKTKEENRTARENRKASGVRLPADTLRAVRMYAAEHDLRDWEAMDTLLRRGLGLPRKD